MNEKRISSSSRKEPEDHLMGTVFPTSGKTFIEEVRGLYWNNIEPSLSLLNPSYLRNLRALGISPAEAVRKKYTPHTVRLLLQARSASK